MNQLREAGAAASMSDKDLNSLQFANAYPGLKRLFDECSRVYPDQENPLLMKTRHKYWQNGPDPLDYICIYKHPGTSDGEMPPHWHYISFGLSDLYGDGRVHLIKYPPDQGHSGFGFEISFRLRRELNDSSPPLWPGQLLQKLAVYVFSTGNQFVPGDHISWHKSLRGDDDESRIQHMLISSDPELNTVVGPFGIVKFVQIVGITVEELEAAQHWNGLSFIEILRQNPICGGRYLINDLRRGESIFELDPAVQEQVQDGIARDGSNLSGVSAMVSWSDDLRSFLKKNLHLISGTEEHSANEVFEENELLELGLNRGDGRVSLENQRELDRLMDAPSVLECLNSDLNNAHITPGDLDDKVLFYDNIHLSLNLEAALLFPLVLKGRVRHGKHFTFKSPTNETAVTIVSPTVHGSYVNATNKFGSKGLWLQIYMEDSLIDKLLKDFDELKRTEGVSFPKTILCIESKFALTITV